MAGKKTVEPQVLIKTKPKLTAIAPIEDVQLPTPEELELISKIGQVTSGPEAIEVPQLTSEELESLSINDPEFHRLITGNITIEDFLKQGANESEQAFTIRSHVTTKIASIGPPTGPIDHRTCVVLGSMIAQKVLYNIVYNDRIESIIQLIISKL